MLRNTRLRSGLVVAVAAVALTGCGGGSKAATGGSTSGGSTNAGTAGNTITIKNFMFSPTPLKVKVGQEIKVTNTDSATHTITASDKSFDSKDIKQNASYSFKIDKAGTYNYICSIHQYMTGEIIAS